MLDIAPQVKIVWNPLHDFTIDSLNDDIEDFYIKKSHR